MRLFVAIVPPPSALAELSAAVQKLRAQGDDPGRGAAPAPVLADRPPADDDRLAAGTGQRLRWTSTEQWHLTLAFLGEVDDAVLAKLLPRLERAVPRHPVQRLAIAGAGAFPSPRKARVLWAGLRADNRALGALATSVAAAARRAGAAAADEDRRFKAHLTLARCRDPADLSSFTTALADFAGQEWAASSVRLIHSYLLAGPPQYETVGEWALRPESAAR
ncbi:MAG: RNA 2',3'-cyclic phosphodiesterase [Streptosporangiaceae bacterium]